MKPIARLRAYRDQGLMRDISFLLLAVGFLLVKVFEMPLESAFIYAPLILAGVFASLLFVAHGLIGVLHLVEALGERLGFGRGPRR